MRLRHLVEASMVTHLSKLVQDLFAKCHDVINPRYVHLHPPHLSDIVHSLDLLDGRFERLVVNVDQDDMHANRGILVCCG